MARKTKREPPEAAWPMECILNEARTLDEDDDRRWLLVDVLWKRGTREVWQRAAVLCESESAAGRELGADVLGQLGAQTTGRRPKFWRQSVPLLLKMLARERDDKVLASVVSALGHMRDARTVASLSRFKHHESIHVRWHLTLSMAGRDDPLAIATLIEMTRDLDSSVRDWATFGIGSQTDMDTPEIRAALLARLSDDDDKTRQEAIAGLAHRRDRRAVEPLLRELQACDSSCLLEAAKNVADPRLLPVLLPMLEEEQSEGDREELNEIIRRCRENAPL